MKQLTISTLLLYIAFSASANDSYDLKRCLETGLEQNYEIRIVRNTQQISDNNATLANAGYLPNLNASAGYSGSLNDVNQEFSTGGTVSNTGVHNQTLNAGVNLNWTIFDGFNIQTNYSKLKELQQIGELQTQLTIENFIANFSGEYYNYVQQNIRLNNLKSAVKLSKERLRIVEARYNIGSSSRLDVQQAKVDFNTDSSRLIRQQEVLYASRIKLNRLMAANDATQSLEIADTVIAINSLINKNEILEKTLTDNSFLRLSEKEKNMSVLDLKAAQSENYPYLRLNAGYGLTRNNYDIGTYTRQDQLGLNYGVTLGFNLFDGNRIRKQKNARVQIESRELAYRELELSLKSDFSNLWMAYQNNMELAGLEKENLQTAKEYYEIAIDRYKLGDLSGLELREAQNSLLEAEERLVQARYNTKLCEISLMQISGQVAGYLE